MDHKVYKHLFNQSKYKEIIELLTPFKFNRDPNINVKLAYYCAIAYCKLKQYSNANSWVYYIDKQRTNSRLTEKSLALINNSYYYRGLTLYKCDGHKIAIKFLDKITKDSSLYTNSLYYKGKSYIKLNNMEEGTECFLQILNSNSFDHAYFTNKIQKLMT